MNDALLLTIGALLGAGLTTWRTVRTHAAARAEARANLAREQRRNATHVKTIAQLHKREHIAVAQIVSLTYALADAAAQVQGAHGATAVIGADLTSRFSVN